MSEFTEALKRTNTDPRFQAAYDDAVSRERFLKSLIQMRCEAGMSQKAVAKAMGVGQSTISQFENATDPRLSTVQRYSRAIGAQTVFVASMRKLQSGDWRAPRPVQPRRTTTWEDASRSTVAKAAQRSAFAKAA